MMKRYIAIFLLAALALIGCVKEIDGGSGNYDSSETIMFSSSMEDLDNSPMTRAVGGYAVMEMSDWEDANDSDLATRAAVSTSLSGYASVYAYQYETAFDPTNFTRLMDNVKFKFSDEETLEPVGDLTYWSSLDKDKKAFFCSYAPYYEGAGTNPIQPTVYPNDATGKPGVTYTVPKSAKDQTDVLYASAEVAGDYKQAVPFEYRHALTAIQFKMGFPCKVDSISIQNVNTKGTFTFSTAASGNVWDESNTSGNYTITFGDEGTAFAEGDMLIEGENTLMLIPQSFASDATAKVALFYTENGAEKTISASLAGSTWGMGKKIVYTLYNTEQTLNYVYFDLDAASVSIKADSYEGAIYVTSADGTSTTAQTVSGTPTSDTKYYIYQSSTNTESVGYKTKTGIQLATGEDAATIVKNNPDRCRVPNYKEITCNGKSWGDYITNNEDLRGIISNWTSGAATAGRTSTLNNIIIDGSTTYNVTLDNIWTKYYANKTSTYAITSQGLQNATEGDIIIKNNGSTGKFNLKLKGDNRIYRIFYDNNTDNKDQAYLRFTSIDGDGSSTGTLTAAPERPVDKLGEGVAIIGPSDNGDHSYGVIFDGGTIFASDPFTYSDSEEKGGVEGVIPNANYHMCTIGGGGNGAGRVYINGGTLTALGHSTAPAIGGGGGHSSQGGAGTVEITGGRVYAYTYGVWTKVYSKFVPVTTIGGGGSVQATGAAGTVTISGGYVYAQSRGGAALGGACSPSNPGGNGTVKITGGTVIAKSVGGECLQTDGTTKYTIVPGTAIGGGNGSTGGTATVTITGGTVRTGSVGGGKPVTIGNPIGNATIKISGGDISGQFILAKAGSATPSFTMTDGTIKNSSTTDETYLKAINPSTNTVFEGGAVHMEQGTCTISGGTIKNCSATLGGSVYMDGGTFTLSGGTLSNNKSSSHGGAVYVSGGNVTVTDGTMTKNRTTNGHGGAVYVTGGSFSMPSTSTGKITYNAANATGSSSDGGNGGGVYVGASSGTITAEILSGTVTNNTADYNGGGMCVEMSGTATADITLGTTGGGSANPDISSNEAAYSGGALCVLGSNSNVTINSGKIRGNTSAYQKNQDIRNDGGMVTLTSDDCDIDYKTVTFHSNNGSSETAVQRIVTNTNSTLVVPSTASAWTYEFHTFSKWNTSQYGTGTTYTNGQTMNISNNVDLYAIWTENGAG